LSELVVNTYSFNTVHFI